MTGSGTMEYHAARKRNKAESAAVMCVNLDSLLLQN